MDLAQFLTELARRRELMVVDSPVDPSLEVAALTALAVREHGPALLFTKARGAKHPILTNALASEQRLALALNHDSLRNFGATADHLLQRWADNDPALADGLPICDDPPCQERILSGAQADFRQLPSLTLWPGDAGPCLTAGVVVTKHPQTGQRNAGIYRLQILDATSATLGWHPGSDAADHFQAAEEIRQPLEVAVALGVPPAVLLAAGLTLPRNVDELEFAARVTDCRLSPTMALARCRSVDLMVPAASQIVLEGWAPPGERAREGPFGNHTGLMSSQRPCPTFRLQVVTRGENPVCPCIVAGPPPSESTWMAKVQEAMLRVRLCKAYPEIQDIAMPMEGIYQNLLFIALDQDCHDALDVLRRLAGERELRRFRFLVAVDDGVDCGDGSQVLWRLGNCLDPKRDMVRIDGPLAPWHPSPTPGHGAKLLLDARVKAPERRIPPYPDPGFPGRIEKLWQTLRENQQNCSGG